MFIAQISNPVPQHYRTAFPNKSFPASGPSDAFLAASGWAKVSVFKEHNRATQKLVAAAPYYEAPWVYTVAVEDKTAEEIAADQAAAAQQLQDSIVQATQQRLDAFAKTRGYDDIKSACDYAGQTSVSKFQTEGQYCLDQRALTWAKLYDMLAEVQAGTRPAPSGFEDIEPELPALEWPTT